MDNKYGITREGSGIWKSMRDGDFEEDDVWDVLSLRETSKKESKIGKSKQSPIEIPRNECNSAGRMIPPRASSSNNSSHENKMMQQSSAPVNIPDWSQIPQKRRPRKAYDDFDDDDDDFDDDDDDFDEEGESEYSYKRPPHEVIARRLATSQISSFSVFEGVGRKLKGRDLSKVRNAVLVRTGFLESP